MLAQLSVNIGWAILLTAALSFIGAGVEAPTPEWGSMIAMGFQNIITGHWWPSIFPGLALAITVFGFSLIGSSVEVLADPARRRALAGQLERKRQPAVAPDGEVGPMRILAYIGRRLLFVAPQLVGILLVSFLLVKLIPGDPAVLMLGPVRHRRRPGAAARPSSASTARSSSSSASISWNVVQGDLGTSWQTTHAGDERPRAALPGDARAGDAVAAAGARHRHAARRRGSP